MIHRYLTIFSLVFFFSCASLFSQTKEGAKQPKIVYDTIVKLGGKKIACNVFNVRASSIFYTVPDDQLGEKLEISRKQVEKIIYKTGKKEVFNQPLVMVVEEDQWESVWVTSNPSDVKTLYEVAKLTAESATNTRSLKAAKSSCQIKLQKKAAAKAANVVLLTKSEAKGGYGDFPGFYMEGIAYSFDPPKNDVPTDSAK